MQIIPCHTAAAWRRERQNGLGASDAAPACGLSEFAGRTPLQTYLLKRGELQDEQDDAKQAGQLFEPVIRQWYANHTGRVVTAPRGMVVHPQHAWMRWTPDGITDDGRGVEAKLQTTDDGWGANGSGDVPMDYLLQVQHAMLVSGLHVFDLPVLFGLPTRGDWRVYTVHADPVLQDMILEEEHELWDRIRDGVPPPPITPAEVKRRWPKASGKTAVADDGLLLQARRLAALTTVIGALQDHADAIKADLQMSMGDASRLQYGRDVLATWNNTAGARKFDVKAFAAAHPDLHERFMRDGTGSRQFLLKVKGDTWDQVTTAIMRSLPALAETTDPALLPGPPVGSE